MKKLFLLLALCLFPARATLAPRLLYSDSMGTTHFAHKTFVKGQTNWFVLQPVYATPITCNHLTMVCSTDGTYVPTGTETGVAVLSDGGTMPGFQYGYYSSVTSGGSTTITNQSGPAFTGAMVGFPIVTGTINPDVLSTSCTMTSGSAVCSSSGGWASYMVGKRVEVAGAGASGTTLAGTVASFQSNSQVTLSVTAGTNVTGASTSVGNGYNVHFHTVQSFVDANHITTDGFTEPDQSFDAYWFGGLWGQYGDGWGGGANPFYDVCNVSGNTFKLRQHLSGGSCATEPVQPYVSDGSALYLAINNGGCFIQASVSGLPVGTTVTWVDYLGRIITTPGTTGHTLGSCTIGTAASFFQVGINIPTSATSQAYTATFTFSQNADGTGASTTHAFTINAIDQPAVRGTPTTYPALTNRSSWETTAQAAYQFYCQPTAGVCSTSDSSCLKNQGHHGRVNVSGTAVTWVSGDDFTGVTSSVHFWVNGQQLLTTGACSTSTTCTLTTSAGTLNNVSYSWNSSWDETYGFIYGFSSEPQALYYPDGILTYLFAYKYFGNNDYKVCAQTVGNLYSKMVNSLMVGQNSAMQYQETFGWGLYELWKLTGSSTYSSAINTLAEYPCCSNGHPYNSLQQGWGTMPGYTAGGFRENVLGLDLDTAWTLSNGTEYYYGTGGVNSDTQQNDLGTNVGVQRRQRAKEFVASAALATADYPCDGCTQSNQLFYGTYLAHSLRHLDEVAPDDYLLYVAKRFSDYLINFYDITTTHAGVYNTSFNFVGCTPNQMSADPNSFYFGPGYYYFVSSNWISGLDSNTFCGNNTGTKVYADPSLNMFANLWSYVWKNTGIDLYRQYAYDAFANFLGDYSNPKQMNQMFGYDGLSQVLLDSLPPYHSAGAGAGSSSSGSVTH